jgi:hypothetical protein
VDHVLVDHGVLGYEFVNFFRWSIRAGISRAVKGDV